MKKVSNKYKINIKSWLTVIQKKKRKKEEQFMDTGFHCNKAVLECPSVWRGKLKRVENLEMSTVGQGKWQVN